jgi:putative ABC transport system permease protein
MTAAPPPRRQFSFWPELVQGLDNLRAHKLRSVLTMLGMIFGVAAVIAMLSIGAGAQQQMIAFIQQLGVRNIIVEAREAADSTALTKTRKLSSGLSFRDLRMIESSLDGISAVTARKRITPARLLPKPYGDIPIVYGVSPAYGGIASLAMARGRFFTAGEAARPRRLQCWADRGRRFFGARPGGAVHQGQRHVVSNRRGTPADCRAGVPAGCGPGPLT